MMCVCVCVCVCDTSLPFFYWSRASLSGKATVPTLRQTTVTCNVNACLCHVCVCVLPGIVVTNNIIVIINNRNITTHTLFLLASLNSEFTLSPVLLTLVMNKFFAYKRLWAKRSPGCLERWSDFCECTCLHCAFFGNSESCDVLKIHLQNLTTLRFLVDQKTWIEGKLETPC